MAEAKETDAQPAEDLKPAVDAAVGEAQDNAKEGNVETTPESEGGPEKDAE